MSGTRRYFRGGNFAERACPAVAGTPGRVLELKVDWGMRAC
jgi:hypothetical protein